jgi:hypothetical protein
MFSMGGFSTRDGLKTWMPDFPHRKYGNPIFCRVSGQGNTPQDEMGRPTRGLYVRAFDSSATCPWLRAAHYSAAMTSISTSASFGSRATCTVERAGGADVKYLAYTSFIVEKSFMSFRNTVVFTT